jgi:hypothetical protein
MAIRVDIERYEASHGHKPRQPRDDPESGWAFQLDSDPTPVFIRAPYSAAVKQAKQRARYSITVLP